MGRLIDTNDVYNVLTKYYHHKTATQHVALIDALSMVKTVEAIPVDWLLRKADLYDKNNNIFTSSVIRSEVVVWREEQRNI